MSVGPPPQTADESRSDFLKIARYFSAGSTTVKVPRRGATVEAYARSHSSNRATEAPGCFRCAPPGAAPASDA